MKEEDGFTWFQNGRNKSLSKSKKRSQDAPASPADYYTPAGVFEAERDLRAIKEALPPPVDGVRVETEEAQKPSPLNGKHHSISNPQPTSILAKGQGGKVGWWHPTFRRAHGIKPSEKGSLRNVGGPLKPRKLADRIAGIQGSELPASEIPATIEDAYDKKEVNPFSFPEENRPDQDYMAEDFPRLPDTDSVERTRENLRTELRELTVEAQGIVDGRKAHTDEGRKRLEKIAAEEGLIRKTLSLLYGRQRAGAVDFETVPTDESGGAPTSTSYKATDEYLPPGFEQETPTRFPYQATPEDIARQEAEQRGVSGISEPDILERSVGGGSDNPPIEPAEITSPAFRRAEKPRAIRPDSGGAFLAMLKRESEHPTSERDSELESTQTPSKKRFGRVGTRFTGAREKIGEYFDGVEARAGSRRGPTLQEVLERRRTLRKEQFMREGKQVMTKYPVFEQVLRGAKWSDEDIQNFTEALGARHLREQSWLLNEIEGGVVLKIGKKRREVLKKGMRIIREHVKAQERIYEGRAKMSEAERKALHRAVEGGGLLEEDARDYAAMRAGWFGGIRFTPFRHALHGRIRQVLGPVWEAESRGLKEKEVVQDKVAGATADRNQTTSTDVILTGEGLPPLTFDEDDKRTLDIEVARGNVSSSDAAALRAVVARGGVFDSHNPVEMQLLERTQSFVARIIERHRLLG